MPKYAKVNNRVVKEIIEVDASHFDTFVDSSPGTWIEVTTARKTEPLGGSYYDKKNDVFASPKPYDSWTVNSSIYASDNWSLVRANSNEPIAGLGFSSKVCRVDALELQSDGLVSVSLIEYFDVYTWDGRGLLSSLE